MSHFTYLESVLQVMLQLLAMKLSVRLNETTAAYVKLRQHAFDKSGLSLRTKLQTYNAIVVTTLLYACETWTPYRRHVKELEKFNLRQLRPLLHIHWQNHVTNLEVFNIAHSTSVEAMVITFQLRWSGHLVRMPHTRPLKCIFYAKFQQGKRYKDTIKRTFQHSLWHKWWHLRE